jgi:flagellar basal-body rod protein FlgF/flagellar basal-body rod protein FlgG
MDSGFYAACAGLRAQSQALELVANNLANANTGGYRSQHTTFRALVTGQGAVATNPLNAAINAFGVLGDSHPDLAQGHLERTGNALDVAIEGKGFFAVETAAGVLYTRQGNFRVSPKGGLVTAAGDAVLGEQGAVLVPGGDLAISADGTVSAGGAIAAKLRVVEFAPGTPLTAVGNAYYSAAAPAARATTTSTLRQGMLESSNVDPVAATVNLIAVQRHAEMLQRALSFFYSDFNRIAANDLGRI